MARNCYPATRCLRLSKKHRARQKTPGPQSSNARLPRFCRLTKNAEVSVIAAAPAVNCPIAARSSPTTTRALPSAKSTPSVRSTAESTPGPNRNWSRQRPAATHSSEKSTYTSAGHNARSQSNIQRPEREYPREFATEAQGHRPSAVLRLLLRPPSTARIRQCLLSLAAYT